MRPGFLNFVIQQPVVTQQTIDGTPVWPAISSGRKHKAPIQCWFSAGPPSATLSQQ